MGSEMCIRDRGCSKIVANVESEISCAVLCSSEPKEWCISFYFNAASRECRLVLYTDATVNMGDARGWRKFAMMK